MSNPVISSNSSTPTSTSTSISNPVIVPDAFADHQLTDQQSVDNLDNNSNKETVNYIQRFTASSISILNLLQTACEKQKDEDLTIRDVRAKNKFKESSQKFINTMKDPEEEFDYTRFIKKAFTTLKTKEQCDQIVNKNPDLLNIRDRDNKIVTILPGLDLKVGYNFLSNEEKEVFWQYMYLFIDSVFCLIRSSNPVKFPRYTHVIETLTFIETELGKTGVMFKDQIFNPFVGIVDTVDGDGYSVEQMFTGGELPKQHNMSIDSVLDMLGVSKLFDVKKLEQELREGGDKQIEEATEKIIGLLGATNNPDVKDVCNILVQDIVNDFKENGISNIADTLKKVAGRAKQNIEISKMKKTAESMKYFMSNSQDKMKDMKDSSGNPIGEQLMNSMAVPLSMMNFMNSSPPAGAFDDEEIKTTEETKEEVIEEKEEVESKKSRHKHKHDHKHKQLVVKHKKSDSKDSKQNRSRNTD